MNATSCQCYLNQTTFVNNNRRHCYKLQLSKVGKKWFTESKRVTETLMNVLVQQFEINARLVGYLVSHPPQRSWRLIPQRSLSVLRADLACLVSTCSPYKLLCGPTGNNPPREQVCVIQSFSLCSVSRSAPAISSNRWLWFLVRSNSSFIWL